MTGRERPGPSLVQTTWRTVRRYLGDVPVDDLTIVETLLAEAIRDPVVAEQARTCSKAEFARSARLRSVLEDALRAHPPSDTAVLAAAREMSGLELAQLLVECGLYERIRGQRPG